MWIIKLIGAGFGGATLLTKVIIVASVAASLLAAYGIWYHHAWSNGYDRAISDIANKDGKAIARATAARAALNDCRTRGLSWDQSTGQCGGR